MTLLNSVSADIMERLDRMAEISEATEYLARRSYTPEHRRINDLVGGWMRETGMKVHEDAAGNLIGRYEGADPDAPAIVLGSHLDSVIMAGKYDGPLGVLSAIDCVRSLVQRGVRLRNPVEVACFADEEGVRFHSTYLGSRALAGTFNMDLFERPDRDGITLSRAMRDFGLDPDRIDDARRSPEELLCYLEVHIEQGPVLENEGLPLSAVTAISGADRMTVTLTGSAGHAGTVPMGSRRDALSAAAACALAVEEVASSFADTVGTVGQMSVLPGATNVIPGEATFSVDLRAARDDIRHLAIAALKTRLDRIAAERDVEMSVNTAHSSDGVTCAPWLVETIEAAMTDLGHQARRLPSGAGHDAAALAAITDVAMIFVRCKGGISHHPDESITREDAIAGAELLLRTVERIGGLAT